MTFQSALQQRAIQLLQLKITLESVTTTLELAQLSHACKRAGVRGHLAVFTQPYLNKILSGEKTIESRFSKVRCIPFQSVQTNDVLLLKEASGAILAMGSVTNVEYFGPLLAGEAEQVMDRYSDELQLETPFKLARRDSTFISLLYLEHVIPLTPRLVAKSDRRAWVILADRADLVSPPSPPPHQLTLYDD